MSVDDRVRDAAANLFTVTPVEMEESLQRLHRTRRRRATGKVIAAVAVVAVGAGLLGGQIDRDGAAEPASPSGPMVPAGDWVLVTSTKVGTDLAPPEGDEWGAPLETDGPNAYPYWTSVDPATQRFLITADEATALEVATPGRVDPILRYECEADGTGCLGATLGPGPEDVTVQTGDLSLAVIGPDAGVERILGPAGEGLLNDLAWSPDGSTLAVVHSQHSATEGSLSVVLRDADWTATTMYEYSEPAPDWYDAEEHRFGSGPAAFNDWGVPRVIDLQWAPDSARLAFVTATTPRDGGTDRNVGWTLFLGDAATGEVTEVADLGDCEEPVERGQHGRVCDGLRPHMTWTPDGTSISVLSSSELTTYDTAGRIVGSEAMDVDGPIVWMTAP